MSQAKILVVEDEAIVAQDIRQSLGRLGYQVVAVTDNGLDAINLAKQLQPDLILMDIVIKGPMDGIETARKLSTITKIPLVYLSAFQTDEILERSKTTRPYGYLLKPLNERDLNSCLRMALYRFQTEKRLRESEERYFRLAENARDMIFRLSITTGVYEYVNKACHDVTGYTQRDFYSTPMFIRKILHPDWREYFENEWDLLKNGKMSPVYEFQIIDKEGNTRWLNQRNVLFLDENNSPAAIEGIVTDVTGQKNAENQLKLQKEEYRLMFEAIPAMVIIKDTNNKILKANKQASDYIGVSMEEIEGKYIEELFPDDAEVYEKEDEIVLSSGKPLLNIVEEFNKKNTGKVWIHYDKYPYKNNDGETVGIIVMARDVTEIETTRERLGEMQALNKALATSLPDLMFYMDKNGLIKDYRANNKDDLAMPPENFIGKTLDELFPKEFAGKKKEIIKKALETNEVQFFEYQMDINGDLRDFEARYIASSPNDVLSVIRDITDKKRTERALKESEEKYKNLTKNAPVAFTRLIVKKNRFEIVNHEFEKQSGYTLEEFNNLTDEQYRNQIYSEDREWVQTEFTDWIRNGCKGIKKFVYRILNKRGELIWLDSYHYADFDENGAPIAINQIYLNINERKQFENILGESKQYLDAFFSQALDGIFIAKMNTPVKWDNSVDREKTLDFIFSDIHMERVNKSLCEQFGLEESEVMKIKPGEYYNTPAGELKKRWMAFLDKGSSHVGQYYKKPSGGEIFIEGDYYCLYDSDKRFVGYIGIQRDMTQRKQSEEAIKLSEEKFRAVAESIPAQVVIFQDNGFVYVNPYSEVITGYSPEELLKKNFWDIVHNDYVGVAKERGIARQKGEVVPDNYEMKIITKSGEEKWINYSARVINFNGKPGVIGISTDITERKKQQEEIFKSEERYRRFVEQSSEGIFRMEFNQPIPISLSIDEQIDKIDNEVHFAECNTVFCKMYDAVSPEEIIGKRPNQLKYKNVDESARSLRFIKNGYRLVEEETTETDTQGNIFYFVINAIGIIENNLLTRIWGVQRDVTEKRKADEALKRSLVEKEILLKEIHHRVKNNLQIVTSLLKLQSSYVKDEAVKSLFKESQNRVQSMSLIHQKLYQTKDLSHIDFKDYIDTVTTHLQHSYGILGDKVRIITDVKKISLSIDNAIPAGLIINELVSNCLKHAFPVKHKGEIFISMAYDEFNREYWLVVRDNGKGIPEDFEIENSKSFGLKLVSTLVKQMSGTIEVFRAGGTEFRIMFKSAEYKERS